MNVNLRDAERDAKSFLGKHQWVAWVGIAAIVVVVLCLIIF